MVEEPLSGRAFAFGAVRRIGASAGPLPPKISSSPSHVKRIGLSDTTAYCDEDRQSSPTTPKIARPLKGQWDSEEMFLMRHTPSFYRHQKCLAFADLSNVPPRESWRSDSLYEGKCNDVVAGAGPLPASELNGSARLRRGLEDEGNRVCS